MRKREGRRVGKRNRPNRGEAKPGSCHAAAVAEPRASAAKAGLAGRHATPELRRSAQRAPGLGGLPDVGKGG